MGLFRRKRSEAEQWARMLQPAETAPPSSRQPERYQDWWPLYASATVIGATVVQAYIRGPNAPITRDSGEDPLATVLAMVARARIALLILVLCERLGGNPADQHNALEWALADLTCDQADSTQALTLLRMVQGGAVTSNERSVYLAHLAQWVLWPLGTGKPLENLVDGVLDEIDAHSLQQAFGAQREALAADVGDELARVLTCPVGPPGLSTLVLVPGLLGAAVTEVVEGARVFRAAR